MGNIKDAGKQLLSLENENVEKVKEKVFGKEDCGKG